MAVPYAWGLATGRSRVIPLPNACTASPLGCANFVAGAKLMPVPGPRHRRHRMSNLSGAASVTPVPSAPAVPTLTHLACSMRWPVPTVSVSPTVISATAASLMLVAPAVAAADSVVWVAALPTAVTVAIS